MGVKKIVNPKDWEVTNLIKFSGVTMNVVRVGYEKKLDRVMGVEIPEEIRSIVHAGVYNKIKDGSFEVKRLKKREQGYDFAVINKETKERVHPKTGRLYMGVEDVLEENTGELNYFRYLDTLIQATRGREKVKVDKRRIRESDYWGLERNKPIYLVDYGWTGEVIDKHDMLGVGFYINEIGRMVLIKDKREIKYIYMDPITDPTKTLG